MEDSQRDLQQKSLRNVRALVERLERDEREQSRGNKYLLLVAFAPFLVFVGVVLMADPRAPSKTGSCELDAWNAKAAEFERSARQSDPQISYLEVQAKLERERPFLMAAARTDCAFKRKEAK